MMKSSHPASILQKKETEDLNKSIFRYMLSLPPTYESETTKNWPTILFLHGSGEISTDLEIAKKHGIPRLVQVYDNYRNGTVLKEDLLDEENISKAQISENDSSFKPTKPINLNCAKFVAENFITVTPQLDPSSSYGWKPEPLGKLLDEIESNYRVDKDRIYVTGVSMGGYGTFRLAMTYPKKFAAIIPICGGEKEEDAILIKHLPIWVFHGEKDDIVPIEESRKMVREIKNLGGNPEFTVYPEADHDSWTETFNNIEIYNWLLSHKKS